MSDQKTPAQSLKQKQREERATLIREVAYEILTEKGYYETSMDEIAARVGISKGTLYLHFKSKEDLVFSIIEDEINRFLLIVDQISGKEISVRERLEQILLEVYKSIQNGRQLLLAFRSTGLNKNMLQIDFKEQPGVVGLMKRLANLFEEGKRNGEFDRTISTSIMVSVFLGFLQIYSNDQLEIYQMPPESLLPAISQLLFHGLVTKS